mmetsp:Transcript_10985/g.25985  ORF Transcript_10985/g.25985 Transcript_10985/m.25985 type:complete len:270 (-) Transcript_10985:477-1286(-)
MHYGSFAKWYVARLKAQPFLVNVSSGFLLMSTGDVLAQRVEVGAGETQKQWQRPDQTTTAATVEESSSSNTGLGSFILQATDAAYRALQDEIALFGWDKSRTAKMAAWSILFTPFYVGIFKMYDRYLPKKNLPSIAARVGCSFLSSIPINFAFYSYGTFVEHTANWYEERQQQHRTIKLESKKNHEVHTNVDVPYRWDHLVEKTRLKLEAEFVNTIKTSAQFWIPLNFLSFSVIPSHIQPLNLMFFSVFWNCYLSMSQHREVKASSADE